MNTEDTNTPNGGSNNDLYSINVDTGKIDINFYNFKEKDPEKEALQDGEGANSSSSENTIADEGIVRNSGDIKEYSYVGIKVLDFTSKDKENIKKKAEKSKKAHDELLEEEEKDKNNDGIDDRNQ